MATKTITLQMEAYQKLKSARRFPAESFSQVVMRAKWPEETITAGEFLKRRQTTGPLFSDSELDGLEQMKQSMPPAEDKWRSR